MRKKDVMPGDVEKLIERERVCPVCGRAFIPPYVQLWVYVFKGRMICSWGCLQSARQQSDAARKYKKANDGDPPIVRKILAMLDKGMTCRQIGEKLNITPQHVYYYKRTRWERDR